MAGQNPNVSGSNSRPIQGDANAALDRAQATRTTVLEQLGLTAESLGSKGQQASDRIFKKFRGQSSISDAEIQKAVAELKSAHQEDQAKAYEPGAAPDASSVSNWADSTKLKEQRGKTELTGSASAASHPLAQLLGQLKINSNALTPKVLSTLKDAIAEKIALSDSATWTNLAQSLLLAHLQDTNQVLGGTAQASTTPAPVVSDDQGVTRNPELAANAPSATVQTNGVLAARVKNLAGQDGNSVGRREALRTLTKALIKDLELPRAKKSVISSLLGKTVKAASQRSGEINASSLASAAFSELAELEAQGGQPGAYAMTNSLMELVESEAVKQGDKLSPELSNLTANLAAFGLRALIAGKLGKESGLNSEQMLAQLQSAIGGLTGTNVDSENIDLAETTKASNPVRPEVSAPSIDEVPTPDALPAEERIQQNTPVEEVASSAIPPDVKATAQHVMEALNINSLDKSNAGIRKAYEQILATSKGEPEALYLAASQWLDARIGTNRAVHDQKMLEQGVPPGMLQTMINDRFLAIAAFERNPKEVKRNFLMNEKLAGEGANAGMSGNGLGGDGGYRFGMPNGFGTGGLLGPGSPMDADGSKNHIYAQRSLQINAILNDPALSIEDKIFYFMMWFAAYADKEREQKMREIADLDNQSQENNLKRKELDRNLQALYQSRKVMQQTVQAAEQKLRHASPKHEQIKDVKKDIAKLEASENPDAAKLQGLQKKLEGLEKHDRSNDGDLEKAKKVLDEAKGKLMQVQVKIEGHSKQIDELQSNADSGTKSRELLFMELERIQRFRGMLIDMANSFMRDMARRVKEIMQ